MIIPTTLKLKMYIIYESNMIIPKHPAVQMEYRKNFKDLFLYAGLKYIKQRGIKKKKKKRGPIIPSIEKIIE